MGKENIKNKEMNTSEEKSQIEIDHHLKSIKSLYTKKDFSKMKCEVCDKESVTYEITDEKFREGQVYLGDNCYQQLND